jgi:hypothetical protein
MPKASWQPSWSPEMLDPELAFLFLPLIVLVVLLCLLWVCGGWPEKMRRPLERNKRPRFLGKVQRSFAAFRNSNHLARSIEREMEPMQEVYHWSRMWVYTHLLHTAPFHVVAEVFLSGTWAFAMSWGIMNGVHFDYVAMSTVLRNLEGINALMDILLPSSACILAFYIFFKLLRFHEIMNNVTALQVALEKIAMLVGTTLTKSFDNEDVSEALHTLSRHLNLVHHMVYLPLSVRFENYSLTDLVIAGVLLDDERDCLKYAPDRLGRVVLWITYTLTRLCSNSFVDPKCTTQVMGCIPELRTTSYFVFEELRRVAPLTFTQLAQVAADAVCMMTPAVILLRLLTGRNDWEVFGSFMQDKTQEAIAKDAAQNASDMMYKYHRGTLYSVPVIGSMWVCLCYQSTLKVIDMLQQPFGLGPDHLNPDQLMHITENKISAHLTRTADADWRLRLDGIYPAPKVVEPEDADDDDLVYGLADLNPEVLTVAGRAADDVWSVTSTAMEKQAPREDGRPNLPTAIVFSDETMKHFNKGTVDDTHYLREGVLTRLQHVQRVQHQKEEDAVYWIQAVEEILPKLQRATHANALLRERLVVRQMGAEHLLEPADDTGLNTMG